MNKYGYIDRNGTVIIQPMFDDAGDFHEGLAAVRFGQSWGYIDTGGRWIIEPSFVMASSFSEGLALVRVAHGPREPSIGGLRYINREGKVVLPGDSFRFIAAESFSEGLAPVALFPNRPDDIQLRHPVGEWVYIRQDSLVAIANSQLNGARQTDGASDYCARFVQSRARVRVRGRIMYINRSGEQVGTNQFYYANDFSQNRAQVVDQPPPNSQWGYIDESGTTVIPCKFKESTPFRQGLAGVRAEGSVGYIDASGRWAIRSKSFSPIFLPGWFSEDLAPVKAADRDRGSGYINRAGDFVVKPQFADARSFSEGLAAVLVDIFGGDRPPLWGFIDRTGNTLIKPQFVEAGDFHGGLAHFRYQD